MTRLGLLLLLLLLACPLGAGSPAFDGPSLPGLRVDSHAEFAGVPGPAPSDSLTVRRGRRAQVPRRAGVGDPGPSSARACPSPAPSAPARAEDLESPTAAFLAPRLTSLPPPPLA